MDSTFATFIDDTENLEETRSSGRNVPWNEIRFLRLCELCDTLVAIEFQLKISSIA